MRWYKFSIEAFSGGYTDIMFEGYIQAESEIELEKNVYNELIESIGKESADVYFKFISYTELSNSPKIIYTKKFFYR